MGSCEGLVWDLGKTQDDKSYDPHACANRGWLCGRYWLVESVGVFRLREGIRAANLLAALKMTRYMGREIPLGWGAVVPFGTWIFAAG